MRQASGENVNVNAEPDEDLKLMALNGLMNSDPERAIPMLEKILQGNQSPKLKERALFVLSQNDNAKARQILLQIARGGSRSRSANESHQLLEHHGVEREPAGSRGTLRQFQRRRM